MMNVIGRLCQLRRVSQNCRNLHATCLVKSASAYEGPGKTTVTFVSKEIGSRFLISRCDETGFTLNTGTKVLGPMVLLPRYALCWNIASGKHINEESLSLFTVLEPKPDLVIIGLDDKYDFSHLRNLREIVQKLHINTEITSVYNACTVFNFVNEEGRYVIACLIPPKAPEPRLKLPKSRSQGPKKQIADSDITSSSKAESERTTSATK